MSRWRGYSLIFLTASAFFLYAFPSASIPYVTLILLHTGIGILFALLLLPFLLRQFRSETLLAKSGWVLLIIGTGLGLALIKLGTPNRLKSWLFAHILVSVIGFLFVATDWL
ncbi:MAG TPA: hypothetical protein VFF42_05845, partial [Candidatus Eremiobacteraceae bacterium]|nr:hypothetical protein [Candidatus Eremiobacteraceae bacterium]